MNRLPYLFLLLASVGFAQTPITDANFNEAITICLSTNPVDGLCYDSEFGAMPDWDVSAVTDMSNAFAGKPEFNADLSAWDVSNVSNMSSMFVDASSYNQPMNNWNVSQVTSMNRMFHFATVFNQPIGNWDVSSVSNIGLMFSYSSFNQPIGNWDVSNLNAPDINGGLFEYSPFNQDISSWDVSNLKTLAGWFRGTPFNQDISSWDVSNVEAMVWTFEGAGSFNQDISSWDVSNVTDMRRTFNGATSFNQDIGDWDVSNVTEMGLMLSNSGLTVENYDATLEGWSTLNLQNNLTLGAESLQYCNSEEERQSIIDNYGWTIIDAGLDPNCCQNDTIPPYLSIPLDTSISCEFYYSDIEVPLANGDSTILDLFGEAIYGDNCEAIVDYSFTYSVDACGIGSINRFWTVDDPSGNGPVSGSQTIDIYHVSDWSILFPGDVIGNCNNGQLPDFGWPTISNDDCEMIAVSHADTEIDQNPNACFEIMRIWEAINWCTYPNEPNQTDTQFISITDTEAPIIDIQDFIVEITENDCDTQVTLPTPDVTDCSDDITITTSSDLPAGEAGPGTYTANYTVSDGCGNISNDQITITVVDAKKPTPYVTDYLVTEIMQGGMSAVINVYDFEIGSFDNCSDVVLSFSPDVNDTERQFDCSQLGDNTLEVWVTDEAGNQDFATVTLEVQDNMGACGPVSFTVAGVVTSECGDGIPDATIDINGGLFNQTTDATGTFTFDLPAGGDYAVVPSLDADAINGVTTFDVVLITQHILGINTFNSPYQMIAADANNSGSITTLDVVAIRKVILQIEYSFPNNTSWRFVDADHVFAVPTNPFATVFPEFVNINNLASDQLAVDFTGIKIGDVGGAGQYSGGCVGNPVYTDFTIDIESLNVDAGQNICVPVMVHLFDSIVSAQFSINYDETVLEYTGAANLNLANLTAANILNPGAGDITFSWLTDDFTNGTSVLSGTAIFELCFDAIGNDGDVSVIDVSGTPTSIEVSDITGSTITINEVDGSVTVNDNGGSAPVTFSISPDSTDTTTGSNVCLDVTVAGFTDLIAMQYSMNYDPAVLEFTGTANLNLANLNASNIGNPSPGALTISWLSDDLANGTSVSDLTSIYQVCFDVIGGSMTESDINFTGSPTPIEIADATGATLSLIGESGIVTVDGGAGSGGGGGGAFPNLTVEISDDSANAGDNICLPILVHNFDSIVSLQYSINYNNSHLSYTGYQNLNLANLNASNIGNPNIGNITFSWLTDDFVNGTSVADGTAIFDLCFDVTGSDVTSTLDISGITIPVNEVDGSVTINDNGGGGGGGGGPVYTDFTIEIEDLSVGAGQNICVPVLVHLFEGIVLAGFSINYDPAILSFTGAANFNLANLNAGNIGNPGAGDITFSWITDDFVNGTTVADGTAIFELCFDAIGNDGDVSVMDVSGTPTSIEVTDIYNSNNVPIEASNAAGNIIPLDGETGTVIIGSDVTIEIEDLNVVAGQNICVPVYVHLFDSIVSAMFSINYDETVLEYTGSVNFNLANLTAGNIGNPGAGDITFSWITDDFVNGTTVADGTAIFELCFDAIGNDGDVSVMDVSGTPTSIEVTDVSGATITVNDVDGLVNIGIGPSTGPDGCRNSPLLCNISLLDGYQGQTLITPPSNPCPFFQATDCPNSSCENNQWFSFIADTTYIELEVLPSACEGGTTGNSLQGVIWKVTDCNILSGYTPVSNCFSSPAQEDFILVANNLVVGEIYTIMLDGFSGSLCNYEVNVLVGGSSTEVLTALCQDLTVELNDFGLAQITAEDIDDGSAAISCATNLTYAIDQSVFTCDDIGASEVILTITAANGDQTSCSSTVTVLDNLDPTAVCQDITIELDDNGIAYLFPPDIDEGSYDNCALSYLEIDQSSFDCSSSTLNNVTLTAFDESGNEDTCVAEVTVLGANEPVVLTQTENACEFYYWNVTDEIYFESGLITETSSSGVCDTVYVLDLNIGEITDYTILVNSGTVSTTNNTASYQWLDCDDDYAPIAGATNQSYTPPSSGNFALELTEGGCTDTTACVYVVPTNTTDLQTNTLNIYPNPTQDIVTINLDSPSKGILKAYDLQGRLIYSQPVKGQSSLECTIEGEAGLYLIEFVDDRGEVYVGKVVKM